MVGKIGIVRSLNFSNIILVYDIYFVNIYIKKRRIYNEMSKMRV
nr:MAG TPA: hypothetical protein [Caudoviricetes sp.]